MELEKQGPQQGMVSCWVPQGSQGMLFLKQLRGPASSSKPGSFCSGLLQSKLWIDNLKASFLLLFKGTLGDIALTAFAL